MPKKKTAKNIPKKKSFNLLFWSVKWALMGIIWAGALAALGALWFGYDLPDANKLLQTTRKPGISIVARNGTLISTHGAIFGKFVDVKNLPAHVPNAILAIEDRRFRDHFGVDILGLMRAAWVNYQAKRVVQGGSTITQQLAKNFLLSEKMYIHTDKSLRRKVQEVLLSLWLEYKFSKDQILSIYLNRVYLGSGTYGVGAAAKKYFYKNPNKLTVYEAAVIAGLLKAPSKYSPTSSPQNADERANIVLDAMVEAGFLNAKQRTNVRKSTDSMTKARAKMQTGQYFADWVMDTIPDLIGEIDRDLVIVTTYDPKMQKSAERSASTILQANSKNKNVNQVALVSMTYDGAVRAMVGGSDHGFTKFNRATQAKRQSGSAFKTFVFLTGLESGMGLNTTINDGPIKIGKWQPKNYHWQSRGEISVQTAFTFSVNTVAVRIARMAGKGKISQMAHRLGITTPIQNDLSIALGTPDIILSELTGAFAAVANGGMAITPYGITEIRDRYGKVLYRHKNPANRALTPETAYNMKQLLIAVGQDGTARKSHIGSVCGGKTGTSQDYRDAWYVGFSEKHKLVTGVWFGNDDRKPMKRVTGGTLPAMVWKEFHLGFDH